MTIDISDNAARVSYTVSAGATVTSFAVSFEFFEDGDLSVYVDGTLKTITTHYTLSGGSGSTGTVTMSVTGASGGSSVVIVRDTTIERTSDFSSGTDINRAALNTQLDTLTAIAADNKDRADRSITAPVSEVTPVLVLPSVDNRKGTVLGFNATSGNVEAGPSITAVQSLSEVTASINLLGTAAVVEDMGILATTAIVEDMGLLGTSGNVAAMAKLGVDAVIADMAILGTSAIVEDMAILGTDDVVADMAILATSDIVTDMNLLATAAVVEDMDLLATSVVIEDMGLLATAAVIEDMGLLATSAVITDMDLLATSGNLSAMALLGTSDVITDMALLGTSAVVADLAILGTTDAVADMNTLATTDIVSDLNTLAAISSDITAAADVASSIAASGTNATNAANSATASASSASASAGSATAAANSASAAAAAFDSFDDRYLGSKSSAPTVDNDGNALVEGALYFDSSSNGMKVYDGSNWIAASSAGTASLILYEYTATNNQTTFSGSDDNSATLGYTVGNIQVVLNGVILDPSDYTASSGTSVVLGAGATTNDLLNVYAFKSFTVSDTVSASAGGTFAANVAFGANATFGDNDKAIFGAGSDLQIYHDGSDSFIDDAGTGSLYMRSNSVVLGKYTGEVGLVATADGSVDLYYNDVKKLATSASGIDLTGTLTVRNGSSSTEQIILGNTSNTGGRDWRLGRDNAATGDFIIKSSDATNNNVLTERMRIDSSGNVGIGSAPSYNLHIEKAGNQFIFLNNASTNDGFYFKAGTGASSIQTNGGSNVMNFFTSGSERMRIDSNGALLLGATSRSVYYNSVNAYNASAVIKTNVSNEVADLVITNGNNDFGSSVDFARTNSAGNDVRFATISAQPTNTTAGSEAGVIRFYTKGTGDSNVVERMRLDASGSVGIGCTPASTVSLDVQNLSASSNNVLLRIKNTTNGEDSGLIIEGQNGGAREYKIGVNVIANSPDLTFSGPTGYKFYTAGSERMSIDSSGTVGVNGGRFNVIRNQNSDFVAKFENDAGGGYGISSDNSAGNHIFFYRSGSGVGTITDNGTTIAFNTVSDYRLKTDVQPMTGASDRVQALNPVNFEWISAGTRVDGFLAHEAQAVVPECVTGTKDAMRDEEYEVTPAVEATYDDDGNELTAAVEAVMGTRSVPDMQGIDQSKIVPLLTAALREALTKIDDMETRLAALEAV